jgi:hypothetical protein
MVVMKLLAAAATASRAGRDGSGLELLEVLEHADHRVARGRVRLVGDRATERDAKLRAELGLDQAIRPEGFLGIVVVKVGLTTGGCDPDSCERCGATARLRDGEVLDGRAEALADQRNRRQSHQTVVVVIGPTEDRACH